MSKAEAIGYIIGAVLGLTICLVFYFWNKKNKEMTEEGKDAYIKKLLTSNIDQHNKISFLSAKVQALQKQNGELADNVKELEAEVKEWKDKADLWCKTANLKDHNIMINKELEKENAELKTDMATAIPLLERAKEISESLTKAKDLLLKVADVCGYPNYDIPVELYADIEHFISEVEK